MKDYDVIPSSAARAYLGRLELEAREDLIQAILEDLKPNIASTSNPAEPILSREVRGYYVDYRNLRDDEKKRFNVRDGRLLVDIRPVTKGFWDWLR